LRTRAILGGGWCGLGVEEGVCLGEEVGACWGVFPLEEASVTRVLVRHHLLLLPLFWLFRCVGCLERACPVVFEPFPCDWLVVCTNSISCLSSYILIVGVRWAGYFCFEIGSWCLAAIMFDFLWCSMVYQG